MGLKMFMTEHVNFFKLWDPILFLKHCFLEMELVCYFVFLTAKLFISTFILMTIIATGIHEPKPRDLCNKIPHSRHSLQVYVILSH